MNNAIFHMQQFRNNVRMLLILRHRDVGRKNYIFHNSITVFTYLFKNLKMSSKWSLMHQYRDECCQFKCRSGEFCGVNHSAGTVGRGKILAMSLLNLRSIVRRTASLLLSSAIHQMHFSSVGYVPPFPIYYTERNVYCVH